jgi:hypothetical protein
VGDGPKETDMNLKMLLAAALTFALLTVSVRAQGMPGGGGDQGMGASGIGGGGKHRGGNRQQTQQKDTKPQVDDKAYRSAIESVPEQKFDPWHNMR